MATLTKSTGTVTLSGAAEKITLPASYGWVWVKNMSEGDIFAGVSADISEGADGVLTIPAGECGRVQTDGFSSVYLLGTGNALVVAQNYADCPFKSGAKGGEIPDLSAYAKKTDIPTELPADGGTAYTISEWGSTPILDLNTTNLGFVAASETANAAPNTFWSTVLSVGQSDSTYGAQLAFPWSSQSDQYMKYRVLDNGVWHDWKKISTTPIKSTTFSATADGTGNFNLWTPSENKVPISIQLDNKTFYAVPFLYNNQLWLGSTINEVTRQPVADTTVSGTIYYIEI